VTATTALRRSLSGAMAALVDRHPWWIVAAALVLVAIAGAASAGLTHRLEPFGDQDPATESARADLRIYQLTRAGAEPGVAVLVRSSRREIAFVRHTLRGDRNVAAVRGYARGRRSRFLSRDHRAALVLAFFRANDDKTRQATASRLRARLAQRPGVTVGGPALADLQIDDQVSHDLARAELLAFPLLFLLSFLFFRGLVAALLPPLLGALAIVVSLGGLRVANEIGPISLFAVNLVTGLGVGLAIDYSLFVVSRYREEIASDGPGAAALQRTYATAGRTVLFSTLTVASATSALLVFPQSFLFSMGVAGVIVSLAAGVAGLVVLPAILTLLGTRINALAPQRLQRAVARESQPLSAGAWYRLARFVMKRPWRVAAIGVVLLLALSLPVLGARFTTARASDLPQGTSSRQVSDELDRRFSGHVGEPLRLVVNAPPGRTVSRLRDRLRAVDGVAHVSAAERLGPSTTLLGVTLRADALSARAQRVVRQIRALDAPVVALAAGDAAAFVDLKASLRRNGPKAAAIVVAVTMLLLFLMTGSAVLPVMSLLLNGLTAAAVFGVLAVVFQEHGLDQSQLILIFALVFGLSTDYGVFVLARIKEARDSGRNDGEAVAAGLERTGRIVTSAAVLFAVAVGAFTTSQLSLIAQLGFGTALGVLLDATVVRALLVPALMRLMGWRSWWAPAPLRALHRHLGLAAGRPPG
jgi:uncharacterized membrane protein YdfJ with MMPL/SSD domain